MTTISKQTILDLAPILMFHPQEVYMPMDPLKFIKKSRLRRHLVSNRDQGYHKVQKKWKTSNSQHSNYYDIPVEFINGKNFRLDGNGKNRRPKDPDSSDKWQVFLQPKDKPKGAAQPTGVVPAFYYVRKSGLEPNSREVDLIQYWWFIGYNDGFLSQNHQGDWEHASAVLLNGTFIGAFMSAHGKSKFCPQKDLDFVQSHFIAYCAKGSHASYPKTGTFHFGTDVTAKNGVEWQTNKNLKPLESQPWKEYAGAWGEVGQIKDTTGPLGPWYKRWSDN